jgi:ATP dependent DNA ligase C terminal region
VRFGSLTKITTGDLHVAVIGQLLPTQLALDDQLEPCRFKMKSLNGPLWRRRLVEQSLEDPPGYADGALIYGRLQPLAVERMPLSEPPPRGGRFGSPLVLSRVHWVRPEMVVEVSFVEMTADGLLRHVVYLGEREDKPARDVIRPR